MGLVGLEWGGVESAFVSGLGWESCSASSGPLRVFYNGYPVLFLRFLHLDTILCCVPSGREEWARAERVQCSEAQRRQAWLARQAVQRRRHAERQSLQHRFSFLL